MPLLSPSLSLRPLSGGLASKALKSLFFRALPVVLPLAPSLLSPAPLFLLLLLLVHAPPDRENVCKRDEEQG